MKVNMLLMAVACLGVGSAAWAQTVPKPTVTAKPAPGKPSGSVNAPALAASGAEKSLALGNGKSGGPLLTRDELRTCLSQEESIRTRLAEVEARRGVLDQEKADLGAAQQALRTERAGVDDIKKKADDLNTRMKAYSVRVEAWNQRVAAFSANKGATPSERQRQDINAERDELEKQQKALDAEKAALSSSGEATLKAYNDKASALDARVVDWNQRTEQWNAGAKGLEAERTAWVEGCADRRYRDDDEAAIRKGK
jgi:chromosome segregation ATPase